MDQIKQELEDESALLKKFGGDPMFDQQANYRKRNSYRGEGKYPPDWDQRRTAIWWLQDDHCGRCGRDTADGGHVHHLKHLSDGGSNRLENLVGLCTDCHSLMHPTITNLDGHWSAAPAIPCEGSHDEVTVISRENFKSGTGRQTTVDTDFEKLEAETGPHDSVYTGTSPVVYDLPSSITRRFSEASRATDAPKSILFELNSLLLVRGRVPENEVHNTRRLQVDASQTGLLGWLSPSEPRVDVTVSDAKETGRSFDSVRKTVSNGAHDTEVVFSENVTEVTVDVTNGDGEVTREQVTFNDKNTTQSLSVGVSPPSLSIATAGTYARSFGEKSLLLPILYGMLWLLLVPTAGGILIMSSLGLLVGAVGSVLWALNAVFLGGSWTVAGQSVILTVLSFVGITVATMILEYFGIDLGE